MEKLKGRDEGDADACPDEQLQDISSRVRVAPVRLLMLGFVGHERQVLSVLGLKVNQVATMKTGTHARLALHRGFASGLYDFRVTPHSHSPQ